MFQPILSQSLTHDYLWLTIDCVVLLELIPPRDLQGVTSQGHLAQVTGYSGQGNGWFHSDLKMCVAGGAEASSGLMDYQS